MNDGTIAELVGVVRTLVSEVQGMRSEMSSPSAHTLTRKQAAKSLNVSLSTLKRYIKTGLICVAQGDPRLIPLSEIRRFSAPREAKVRTPRARKAAPYSAAEEMELARSSKLRRG